MRGMNKNKSFIIGFLISTFIFFLWVKLMKNQIIKGTS